MSIAPLPPRREGVTERVTWSLPGNAPLHAYVTVNFDPATGRFMECFCRSGKPSTFIDGLLDDLAVLVSVGLRGGIAIGDMRARLARDRPMPGEGDGLMLPEPDDDPDAWRGWPPTSVVGCLLDTLAAMEAELVTQEEGAGCSR